MSQFVDRKVGSLLCSEVLAAIGDYLDHDLPPVLRAQVGEHLSGCDNCARFGGQIGELLAALSVRTEPLDQNIADRLQQRLQREAPSQDR